MTSSFEQISFDGPGGTPAPRGFGGAPRSNASVVRGTRAIVLAAGTGTRLTNGQTIPKPLRTVSSVPLIVRVLRALQDQGVREAVVVIGHMGDMIRRRLLAEPSLALSLTFVQNDLYKLKNGVSLLAARSHVVPGTILSMADHLYSPEVVRRLQAADIPEGGCALAVDYDPERCFDLDDATKVVVERRQSDPTRSEPDGLVEASAGVRNRIVEVGKELSEYNALDTGVFMIGPELLDELAALYEQNGDCSLSEGVSALAARQKFVACDIGDARWIDVDTPETMQRAEAMIRVFGDALGDEPAESLSRLDPDAVETFAPTWVRAAKPYQESHFETAAKLAPIRMMSNESPFPPSARVVDAVLQAVLMGNQYPGSAEHLRERLARREGLDKDWVMLGAGSTELIDVGIRTFAAPGEEVLISVPTFSMYEARARVTGAIPVLVPLTAPDDDSVSSGGELDVPQIISAVTERTKLIFLCTPNNPTGKFADPASVVRLLRLGLPTIIDEAYLELSTSPKSFSAMLREYPNAIVLRTFSKAFGLAGMRLGYALANPSVIKLLSRVKIPWTVPSLTLAAAMAVLEDSEEQSRRLEELRNGRDYLVEEFSKLAGVEAFPSEGNFVLIDATQAGMRADKILEGLLLQGVLVRSLGTHHAQRDMLRVTVGTTEQNRRCAEAFRVVLSSTALPVHALDS